MIASISNGSMRSRLKSSECIEFIKSSIATNPSLSQHALAKLLCKTYSFVAPNGSLQISGCLVVLNDFCKKGLISLPKALSPPPKFTPMVISDKVYPLPENLPETVELIKDDLEIILIESTDSELKQVFNDLIGKEHPCRNSRIVGYQVKYLIKYKEFYIGAACFSSCAFNLEVRDLYLEWTKEQKSQHQNKVVCMSRFLIRNQVNCANLASHLLSKLVTQIKIDFANRYQISPWLLESFVDTESFAGTCYKAANWVCIGQSKGRGRNDTNHENEKSKKDVYVYVIEKLFRELGDFGPKIEKYLPMNVEEGILNSDWGEHEFRGIDLGDSRLESRVIKIAREKGEDPFASYAKVANGVRKDIAQYYKLIDSKSDKITDESLIAKHKKNTICRMANFKEVLSIHDSSSLNYGTLKETKGLGIISKNKNSKGTRGLQTHTRLACTVDGLPLGVLGSPCTAPEVHKEETRQRQDIPIEEKQSLRWKLGYLDDIEVGKRLPENTQITTVMDREGDIIDILVIADVNREKNPLIVRSQHNRQLLGEDLKLHEFMAQAPINFTEEVVIPPQRSREESSDKKARPYIKARMASLIVTFCKVTILMPENNKYFKNHKPIEMCAIYAREENQLEGSEKIEWMLITTHEVATKEMALKCLGFYKTRWKVEEFFRVLKSGCGVENHKLNDAKKLKRIIAISAVIAWRIMLLAYLGRKCPNLPAECLFSKDELLVLTLDSKKKIETINDAIIVVASYGGHQNRKNDPPPGPQIMRLGFQKLHERVHGFLLRAKSELLLQELQSKTNAKFNQKNILLE